jgi:hypothetical protein
MEEFFLKAAALLEEFYLLIWMFVIILSVNAVANLMRAWRSTTGRAAIAISAAGHDCGGGAKGE